jgi:RNA polymerase sigma-70 factor (ECF subfamily)
MIGFRERATRVTMESAHDPMPVTSHAADIPHVPLAVDATDRAGGERALVARARAGDREAFDAIHVRYAAMVHAIVLAHGPQREAADLTQEVFLRVFTDFPKLRSEETACSWIAGIARNVARDRLRSRRATQALPDDLADAREHQRNRGLAEAREILEAIRALPEAYRETLVMRLVESMTGPEIAERTGMTHGSVRVNLHRGMGLLATELARRGLQP